MRSLNNKNVVIVDARSRKEYVGYEVRAERRGYIPSTVNIDWNGNIEKDVFKSTKVIKNIFKIPKNSQIVTYCQGGYRGCKRICRLENVGIQKSKNVSWFLGRIRKHPTSSCFKWELS